MKHAVYAPARLETEDKDCNETDYDLLVAIIELYEDRYELS